MDPPEPERRAAAVLAVSSLHLSVSAVVTADSTEVELAHALRLGDPRAPDYAWRRYVGLVRKVIRSAVGCGPDVEDVVQEVFLHLFLRLHDLREPTSLRSFVISFAIRIAKWERTRRRRRRWLRLTDTGNIPDQPLLTPEFENRFELELLDRLPLRERHMLALRHLEGMKLHEIAVVTKLSLATVKRVMKRASSNLLYLSREGTQLRGARRLRPMRAVSPQRGQWRAPRPRLEPIAPAAASPLLGGDSRRSVSLRP